MDVEIENYMKNLNVDEICRTCLSECDEMISLFAEIDSPDEDDISFVYQILMNVSSTEICMDDGLPTLICKNCVESANNAFKFKVLCERSAALLHAYFSNVQIKTELNDQTAYVAQDTDNIVEEIVETTNELSENKNIPSPFPESYSEEESINNDSTDNSITSTEQPNDKIINYKEENENFKLSNSNISKNDKKIESDNDIDLNKILITSNYENLEIFENESKTIQEFIIKPDIQIDYNSSNASEVSKTNQSETKTVTDFTNALIVATREENVRLREKIKLKKMYSSISVNEQNRIKHRKKYNAFYKRICNENGEQLYCCSVCDKKYKHSTSLTVHIRTHTMERPYLCTLCGKGFKQFTGLRYHMRGHNNEQPYKCKLCDKKYRQAASLTAHMRIHTGQRPFLCSVCGKGFRQQPDLGYHMRTHTKEKPYMCSVCGKTMRMQCHLVQHMRTHTGEKPFKCQTCDKAFPSSTRLKRHEIIHTDLKPFTCSICTKAFNRESSLKVHILTHNDVRPHVCEHCGKGFIQMHCLKNHLKQHKQCDNSTDIDNNEDLLNY